MVQWVAVWVDAHGPSGTMLIINTCIEPTQIDKHTTVNINPVAGPGVSHVHNKRDKNVPGSSRRILAVIAGDSAQIIEPITAQNKTKYAVVIVAIPTPS